MRYLYFPGCKIAYHLPQYDQSTRRVLAALGICQGYVRLPLVTPPSPLAQEIRAVALQKGIE